MDIFLALPPPYQEISILLFLGFILFCLKELQENEMNRRHAILIADGKSPMQAARKSGCFTAGIPAAIIIFIICGVCMWLIST